MPRLSSRTLRTTSWLAWNLPDRLPDWAEFFGRELGRISNRPARLASGDSEFHVLSDRRHETAPRGEGGTGILPMLLFFLARTGHQVHGNRSCVHSAQRRGRGGRGLPQTATTRASVDGTPNPLSGGDRRSRNLYYFPLDLSNYSLRLRPGFAAFVKKRQP